MTWSAHDVAVITGERTFSWAEFNEGIQGSAFGMEFAGVRAGERIPMCHGDTFTLLGSIAGAWALGAVPCPLNARWTQDEQIRAAKFISPGTPSIHGSDRDSKSVYIVTERARKVRMGGPEPMPRLPSTEGFAAALERRDEAPALGIFTSGSSGRPKAALLSFGNLHAAATASNEAVPLAKGDRWLLSLPLYHVGGLSIVYRCLLAGATMAIPEADEGLAESLERYAPTHVSLVATQLYRLLQYESSAARLAQCKTVLVGGGPMPEGLVRDAVARGVRLVTSFGMTETAAMMCCTRPGDPPERLSTSGRLLRDGTMRIAEDGEIQVRGPQLFLGYLREDGSLDRPLTEDGWFRTGDLGFFDEAGYLHIDGRKDNRFISGGENIQPEELEEALRGLDGVEEAVVVPVADAEWGQRPVAFVKLRGGGVPVPADLEERLRERLAGFKIPRAFYPWPEEAGPGLKVQRKIFEALARERRGNP